MQKIAREQTMFTIRYSANVADLSPLDRIIHEARAYDIHDVQEVGRRQALRIIASARAE